MSEANLQASQWLGTMSSPAAVQGTNLKWAALSAGVEGRGDEALNDAIGPGILSHRSGSGNPKNKIKGLAACPPFRVA